MDNNIKRWKLIGVEIIPGKTMHAKASLAFDPSPIELESWADDAKRGKVNARWANSLDIREFARNNTHVIDFAVQRCGFSRGLPVFV